MNGVARKARRKRLGWAVLLKRWRISLPFARERGDENAGRGHGPLMRAVGRKALEAHAWTGLVTGAEASPTTARSGFRQSDECRSISSPSHGP